MAAYLSSRSTGSSARVNRRCLSKLQSGSIPNLLGCGARGFCASAMNSRKIGNVDAGSNLGVCHGVTQLKASGCGGAVTGAQGCPFPYVD